MSFFKRKDKSVIPPVASEQVSRDDPYGSRSNASNSSSPRPLPSYRSNATYVPSRDGDLYNTNSSAPPSAPRYSNQPPPRADYSRNDPELDKARNELFSGYKPQPGAGSGRYFNDGPAGRPEPTGGEENEEDVEGIKQQLRFTKQESVNSTRNALRLAREAEETARNTLTKLGDQSESLANTERHLDVSKGHSLRAEDKTDELKQLNRSIFRPVITFNKDAKRAAQEAKIQQRYDDDREEREKAMTDIRETHDRLGKAVSYGQDGSRYKTEVQLGARKEQRKRYQFDATASDDEMEDELDDNLNEISDMTKRLKALGSTMGQELDRQNERIGRITEKTDNLDNRIFRNTKKLEKIK
ncbi:protein transporter SEC9 [Cristinia sonorae]|uniref:Protein transporter SEC9 n=1 Tax=Cristinia sonorae TaxID=1940300 RepID=A0A8K0URU0_9AGAR|nr:protein transporter SEC9 [Cristinia sonorae]